MTVGRVFFTRFRPSVAPFGIGPKAVVTTFYVCLEGLSEPR